MESKYKNLMKITVEVIQNKGCSELEFLHLASKLDFDRNFIRGV